MDNEARESGVRLSTTFRRDVYEELNRLATRKRVSVAWVIRDAVDRYLESEMPLFWQSENDPKVRR